MTVDANALTGLAVLGAATILVGTVFSIYKLTESLGAIHITVKLQQDGI